MGVDRKWIQHMEHVLRPDGDRPWQAYVASLISAAVPEDCENPVIVDAGCGVSSWMLKAANVTRGRKIGFDLDPEAANNPVMDEVVMAGVEDIPLEDEIADVVLSSYVLEHVEDPAKAFKEFARILKPGGKLILWTPNRLNYAMIISSITPTKFHNWMRGLTNPAAADNCATYYRANTPRALKRLTREAGLQLVGEPVFGANAYRYLAFSKLLFCIAAFGSRLVSGTPLACLKCMMIAQATKPTK